jgi:hypothetical protein
MDAGAQTQWNARFRSKYPNGRKPGMRAIQYSNIGLCVYEDTISQ